MNKEEATKIVNHNKLILDNAGIDNIPVKTVEIEKFEVTNGTGNQRKTVTLFGLLRPADECHNIQTDFLCTSFFVADHLTYWFRDFFSDAMEVIEALRVLGDYTPENS